MKFIYAAMDFNINTYDDFLKIVHETQNERIPFSMKENFQELYRGQSKDSYTLQPSIARDIKTSEELKKLEKDIIDEFKNLVPPKILRHCLPNNENEWRIIEQMQHYGIPTRLLDWSIDPSVALFFAIENNSNDIGQFWVFKSPLDWLCDGHFKFNPYDNNIDIISNSSFCVENGYDNHIAEQRRSFQSGKFTFQDYSKCLIPLENQESKKSRLKKYSINPNSKKDLLEKLSSLGINKDTINVKRNPNAELLVEKIRSKYFKK